MVAGSPSMSVNDTDDLEAQADSTDATTRRSSSTTESSPEFTSLATAVAHRTILITANVQAIYRSIGFLGTRRDTLKMRTSLLDSLSKTKNLCKEMLPDLRTLTNWSGNNLHESDKNERTKLVSDFQHAMTDFQEAQRLALEKYLEYVKDKKALIDEENEEFELSPDGRGQHFKQKQKLLEGIARDEVVIMYQKLIKEREPEIVAIEMGINDVDDILLDFSHIFLPQVSQKDGCDETTPLLGGKGRDDRVSRWGCGYQKGVRGWYCWILVVLIMVMFVVMLGLELRH